jgi:hypothetical protein
LGTSAPSSAAFEIENLGYQVNGATVFSKLDLTKAFNQLEIDEGSRNYTTVTTHMDLFRYKRLHMGISSAQESFTEEIRVLLADLPGQLNMTDDIVVYGKDALEHQNHLMDSHYSSNDLKEPVSR